MVTNLSPQVHRVRLVWASVLAPFGVAALLSFARESITAATGVLILVLVVLAVATAGDRIAGFLAAASAGIWFDFFLTEPYRRFTIDSPDDVEAAVLLVVIGVAATEVSLLGRRAAARANREAGYLEGVLGVGELARGGSLDSDEVIAVIADRIALVLGVRTCQYVAQTPLDPRVALLGRDGVVRSNDIALNIERDGLPTTFEVAVVPHGARPGDGYFVMSSGDRIVRPSLEQRRLAVHLADQVGGLGASANTST